MTFCAACLLFIFLCYPEVLRGYFFCNPEKLLEAYFGTHSARTLALVKFAHANKLIVPTA
jgi:hypothetical protein